MSDSIRLPEYRPGATPRPVAGTPTRPAARAEPVRRQDPRAPQAPDIAAGPPRGPNELTQIAAALGGLVPGLNQAFGSYMEGVRQVEGAEAETEATRQGMRQDVRNWADAVRANPALAASSPYYRRIFEERLARTVVQRRGNEVFAAYWQSPVAGSEDPTAIQGWLREQFKDTLTDLAENPSALAAASEELRAQALTLTRTHAQNAAQNLVRRNEDGFNAAVGTAFDQGVQRGEPVEVLSARLQQIEAEARAQGVDGRQINRILAGQLQEAIVRHNRTDLARLGSIPRPDGTPGFGATAEGRSAINNAMERVHAASVRASNLAWTNEQRARARAADTAMGAVVTDLMRQTEAGEVPRIAPQTIAAVARIDPDLASKLFALENGAQQAADGRNSNPVLWATLQVQIGQGLVDENGITRAVANQQVSRAEARELYSLVRSVRQDNLLNDGGVNRVIEGFANFVRRPDPLMSETDAGRNLAATQYSASLRSALMTWRQANPTASPGEAAVWLQQEAERQIPRFVERDQLGAALDNIRSAGRSNDANIPQPRPSPPSAPAPVNPTAPQGAPAPAAAPSPPIRNQPLAGTRPLPEGSNNPVGAALGPAVANAGAFLSWLVNGSSPEIPAAAFTQMVEPTAAPGMPARSSGPIMFPDAGLARRGTTGTGNVIPYNYGVPLQRQPTEVHVVALLRGLRQNPQDLDLIREFNRLYGANAAHFFVQQYNSQLNQSPRR